MGLCIAHTIIEAHGGKISAESRPSGAVFHVSLPLAKAHAMTSVSATIHIVDDDASFRTSTGRLLRACGYAVETYASAEELLKRLPNAGEPGCILLDINMPGVSGPDLQARLNDAAIEPANRFPNRSCRHPNDGALCRITLLVGGRLDHERKSGMEQVLAVLVSHVHP